MENKDNRLIEEFLNGKLNEQDAETLKKWMEHPDNAHFLKEETQLYYRLNALLHSVDTEKAYKRNTALLHKKATRRFPWVSIFKYAALMVMLLGSAWLIRSLLLAGDDKLIIPETQITLELEDGSLMKIQLGETREIQTAKGEKISTQKHDILYYDTTSKDNKTTYNTLKIPYGKTFKVQLSDGSLVHLNAGSQLKYPNNFTESKRKVYLQGEAYFEVTPNKDKPFIVQTSDTDIQVLGTKFNVSAYPDEKLVATVLVEGSVKITEKETNKSTNVILLPGQLALWNKTTEKINVTKVDVEDYTSWIEGKLVFESKTFEEMLRVLQRKYNVSIENRYSELNTGRYRGRFEDESIEQIMKTFAKSRLFSYTIKNNTLIIEKPENK
ncbi:fec operon regulator FecR [Mariniflexile rhizosphaerae]|uniref:FecR family protein n=1 Tax=unclassified Mariniflexile TaxID=2643887 RepID=UPI000E337362|nr:FecR family protein [Mariniflexile sp. TRM1-10]AXP79794.1 fec operon regulator FecR [Mariniflexile sp. TRM1-10]